MKKFFSNKYFLLFCRASIGIILIFTGVEKISDLSAFSNAIQNYRIFPIWSVNFIAMTLPWLELFIGIFILFGIKLRENVFSAGCLFIVFNIFITIAIIRGLDIDCGCFGTALVQKVGLTKIAENFSLLIFCIFVFLFDKNENSITKLI